MNLLVFLGASFILSVGQDLGNASSRTKKGRRKKSFKSHIVFGLRCAIIYRLFTQARGNPPPVSALRQLTGRSNIRLHSLIEKRNPQALGAAGFLLTRESALEREVSAIAAQEPRLNEQINVRECRLIGFDGTQMGIYVTSEAQRIADNEGLDLVEIAPNADPPVCRIMDYGKFKYDQAIKAKQARKNQSKIETKEMKFRPKIDVGDYTTKKKHVLRFLDGGNKVKITIMFRGREMAHPEQGLTILERLADDLKDVAVIETQPKMEGRNMHMLIAPLPAATLAKKKKENEKKEEGKDEGNA